jgi:hypothetical protein
MHRQNAAAIFEQVHDGTPIGGREPVAVMVCGVVIANGGVEAASAGTEITVGFVGEGIAFNIGAEDVGVIRTEHHLSEKAQAVRELGGEEQIKLARLKGRVGWGERMAAVHAPVGTYCGRHLLPAA